MGPARFTLVLLLAIAGGTAGSQAPEFSQQYLQRLGGAVSELREVAEIFDEDARAEGLQREAALNRLIRSEDSLTRRRGDSMATTLDRYENLAAQYRALEAARPIIRPVEMLHHPDPKIIREAWEIYEPAVPVTQPGIAWGLLGTGAIGIFVWALTFPFRRRRRVAVRS
jgi:hypothetical protein